MTSIDDKLGEIDIHAARIAGLWVEAIAEARGAGDTSLVAALEYQHRTTGTVRANLHEARRPKGPMVAMTWTGETKREPRAHEVVRRTATRALLNQGHKGTWYDIEYGAEIGKRDRYLGEWRITDAGLATIRAMPVGENDVSRALKAAKNGGT